MMRQFKKLKIVLFLTCFLLFFGGKAFAQTYTVKAGDTLYLLSKRTSIPMEKIKSANTLASNQIYPGQVLLIPQKYIVKKGDTLYLISRNFGIDFQELLELNGYINKLNVGQAIYVPEKSPYKRITVHKGDTLYKIANNYGVNIEDLKKINGLANNYIFAGMKLLLPYVNKTQGNSTSTLSSRGSFDRSAYSKSGSGIYYTQEDRYLLAKLITAEAEGEPYMGKVAVGAVVVNRVKSSLFPNSIKEVIYQVDSIGKYQFSPVLDGRINIAPSKEALDAADDALSGVDPTGGALYFFNPSKISNQWLLNKPVILKISNHTFV
jgi:N-acetylmuramoyl-L-alanine amidase